MKSFTRLLSIFGLVSAKSFSAGDHGVRMSASGNFSTKASSQTLVCYDYNGGGGDSVRAIDYIPALRSYNFDNRISSCCFTGIWFLYAEETYNGYNVGASNYWAYGDNYCEDVPAPFDNKASSVRYTGAPDDWKYNTINIYFNDYFIGDEEFTYNDATQFNYDNRAASIVVTGCQPWTVYQYNNYQGRAMCLFPSDTSKCTPGLYPTRSSLGSLAGDVSSARKGCYAQERVYPVNHMAELKKGKSEGIGASGFFTSH